MLILFLRIAAVSAWLLLAIPLVPGSDRPHTGMPGNAEHFIAYALSGLACRLTFISWRSRYQLFAFSLAAGTFEICQIWIVGRSPGVDNWVASTAGALLGICIGRLHDHWPPSRRGRKASLGARVSGEPVVNLKPARWRHAEERTPGIDAP